jgi:hypothetical protein
VERLIKVFPKHTGPQNVYIATESLYGVDDRRGVIGELGPLLEETLVNAAEMDLGPEPFCDMSAEVLAKVVAIVGALDDVASDEAHYLAEWSGDIMYAAAGAFGHGEWVRDAVYQQWRPHKVADTVMAARTGTTAEPVAVPGPDRPF